ncbi:MAG: hypothetical protein NDJ89_06370 [Oligoflexia bacterium]|nr:hypothetical protein [Oligoflexia bacterium]
MRARFRKLRKTLAIAALAFSLSFSSSDSAHSDEELGSASKDCIANRCQGDYAYGLGAKGELSFGKIDRVFTREGKGVVRLDGKEFPIDSVGSSSRKDCLKLGTGPRCAGDVVSKGGKIGLILATFPHLKSPSYPAVISVGGQPPVLASHREFVPVPADCDDLPELQFAVEKLKVIQTLLKGGLNAPSEASCMGPPREPSPRYLEPVPRIVPGDVRCDETPGPVTAMDSPNYPHFEQLLKKGMSASLGEFLRLWYPSPGEKTDKRPADSILNCLGPSGSPNYGTAEYAPESCVPDVLYSWGPRAKVDTFQQTIRDGKAWAGKPNPGSETSDGTLFLSLSAASTYMYGVVPIRFKLKPKVPLHLQRGVKADDLKIPGEVTYRDWEYQDYWIADSSVIESWSFGTPEHYDEIVRDILRISSGENAALYHRKELHGSGIERFFSIGATDQNPNNEEKLKATLLEMVRMIVTGEGRIYYSKGACRNREEHFATDRPSYLNPRDRL